jgi:glutaredoxin
MFNLKNFLVSIFFIVLALPFAARAEANPVELYFFEGQGCQHCARMKSYLDGLKVDFPNLEVRDFEVYFNKDNQDLFSAMADAYNTDVNGVPTIFIGEEVIVGENFEKVKNAVERCSLETCVSPASKLGALNTNSNASGNINASGPAQGSDEVIGWIIIISAVVIFGLLLIIFVFKRKKNV